MTQIRIMKNPNQIQHQIIDGVIHVEIYSMTTCSGCYEFIDGYPQPDSVFDKKWNIPLGVGCHECSYKGKVRMGMWIPVEKSGRKNCFTCKHLTEQKEGDKHLAWNCEKRLSKLGFTDRAANYMSALQRVDFRLRSKNCHEVKV